MFSALKIKASAHVVIMIHGECKSITGGVRFKAMEIKTPEDWCEYYGLKVSRGVVTLYKALNHAFISPKGTSYAPGEKPEAKDWDGGRAECGGGLHFSPSPTFAREFSREAEKYAACPINIKDIVVHKNAEYPQKVKARRVAKPCYEVDINGDRV